MTLWVIRILFLVLSVAAGFEIKQVSPELIGAPHSGLWGMLAGFGFGGVLIAIDEMIKGFSLRAFSAATFGLLLGSFIAWIIDRSQLFIHVDEATQWIVRLSLFIGFGYI